MIKETVRTVAMHLERAKSTHQEIILWLDTLSPDDLTDTEKIKTIDAFLFRLIKAQDLMGRKMFREVLDAIGDYQESMSMLDVLDNMEKRQLIVSADTWMDYRNLRNLLTHEYPDNKYDIIAGIEIAVKSFDAIEKCFQKLVVYIKGRGLLL